jgi:hypothetical protein
MIRKPVGFLQSAWFCLLLLGSLVLSSVSGYMAITSPWKGSICEGKSIGEIASTIPILSFHCALFKTGQMYNAYVGFKTSGIYSHLDVTDTDGLHETVFFLTMQNGTMLRLIFYCMNGTLQTTTNEPGVHGGYQFCEDLPFHDTVRLTVRGTLITPSEWQPGLSSPRLSFIGDLYVFEVSVS